jgi:hypothetical protein
VQVAGEPTHGLHPIGVPARLRARQGRPLDRVLDRDPLLATSLEIVQELAEQPLSGVEFVAPPKGAFDAGLRPDPFPDRAASLLPGLLAATRT